MRSPRGTANWVDADHGVAPTSRGDREAGARQPGEWSPTARRPTPPTGAPGSRRRCDRARELRGDGVTRILATGFGRVEPAYMPKAPVEAAPCGPADAGIRCPRSTITTHNPFAVNDLWLADQMGYPLERMNPYGSWLVYGHPQGPTGAAGDRRADRRAPCGAAAPACSRAARRATPASTGGRGQRLSSAAAGRTPSLNERQIRAMPNREPSSTAMRTTVTPPPPPSSLGLARLAVQHRNQQATGLTPRARRADHRLRRYQPRRTRNRFPSRWPAAPAWLPATAWSRPSNIQVIHTTSSRTTTMRASIGGGGMIETSRLQMRAAQPSPPRRTAAELRLPAVRTASAMWPPLRGSTTQSCPSASRASRMTSSACRYGLRDK